MRAGRIAVLNRMVRIGHFKEKFKPWLEECEYVGK